MRIICTFLITLACYRLDMISAFPRIRPTKFENSKIILAMSSEAPNSLTKKIFNTKTAISIALATLCVFWSINTRTLYETADSIPNSLIIDKATITGVVVKITDGDTYRVRHTPTMFSSGSFKGKLRDRTIAVRIAGVDTPETAKFGSQGQAFADDATKFAKEKLLGKRIDIKILSRDRYGRIVARVKYREGSADKDMSESLLSSGLAVVYRQKGAEYDGNLNRWDKLEKEAKWLKRGMWAVEGTDLPAEYKARSRNGEMRQKSRYQPLIK